MEHPLLPSLEDLTSEQLTEKLGELNKKLSIAYRMGNHDLCNQIRMAVESYQNKLTEKNRKTQSGEDFGNIIDIS